MTKPITPIEVASRSIPDKIVDIINKLIVRNYDYQNEKSIVFVYELVEEISPKINIDKIEIIRRKWLNFDEIYKSAGWIVKFEHGTNDIECNYKSHFIFEKE